METLEPLPAGFRPVEEEEAIPAGFKPLDEPTPKAVAPAPKEEPVPAGFKPIEEAAPAWDFDPQTFRTKLPDQDYEAEYAEWLKGHQITEDDTYDYRGAFLFQHDPQEGQWPDLWRTPKSPHFTDDSIYFDDLPAGQRAKAKTWGVKNPEEVEKGAQPEYELKSRGKSLYEQLDTPGRDTVLSPREMEEALEYYVSDENTMTAVDAAKSAAKGMAHIIKQMVVDIPVDTMNDIVNQSYDTTGKYLEEGDSNTLAALKGMRDTALNAVTSFTSGVGTAGIEAGRMMSKLVSSIDENINSIEKAPRTGKESEAELGWTSSDYGDLVLFRNGKLTRDQLSERFAKRHAYNKAMVQTGEEMPNPVKYSAAKMAGLDEELATAEGEKVNRGTKAAGEFYGFAKMLKYPSLGVEKLVGYPVRQLQRAGNAVVRAGGRATLPAVRQTAAAAGKKLDDYADALAARGTIAKPTAEAFKTGGSLIKELAIGTAATWVGTAIGNAFGAPQVGALIGGAVAANKRAGELAGIARKGLERVQTTAGMAEAMIRISDEFRKTNGAALNAKLKAIDEAIAVRQAGGNAQALREIKTLQARKRDIQMGRQHILDGMSGRSIFRWVAEKGKAMGLDPKVVQLAQRLDKKSARWFMERGIPTAKAAVAMGTANVLMSLGADLPNEMLAEQFGYGALAFTGLLQKGSKNAAKNKLADAARGIEAMHSAIFRQMRENPAFEQIDDARLNEEAKFKVVELLAKLPEGKSYQNMFDAFLGHRDRTDVEVMTYADGSDVEIGSFFRTPEQRASHNSYAGDRGLIALDTRGQRASDAAHGMADVYFHESGHDINEWARKNHPDLLAEFERSIENNLKRRDRRIAEFSYAKAWARKEVAKSLLEQAKADGLSDADARKLVQEEMAVYEKIKLSDNTSPDLQKKYFFDQIDAARRRLGPEYFLNEFFADAVNDVLTTRDATQLAKGRTGPQENAQGVSGFEGYKALGRRANRILRKTAVKGIAERLVSQFYTDTEGSPDKARRKEKEKGVRVFYGFGKGEQPGQIENEAIARAKQAEQNGELNTQVDVWQNDPRPEHQALPDEKLLVDAEWGKVFEKNAGGYRVVREAPAAIKKSIRTRIQKVQAIREKIEKAGKKDAGWGITETEAGVQQVGGNNPPPRFHLTLKSAGFKPEQVNATWQWMKALRGEGEVLSLWNFGFGTSLNKGSWDKLITSTKAGMVRSQRKVRPLGIKITKKGEVLLEAFDLSVLDLRLEEFAEKGYLRPWDGNIDAVKKDIEQVLHNWKANRRGHRVRKIEGERRSEMPLEKKDIINALIVGRGPKSKLGKNPFRDKLTGKDAAGIIRTFRLDNVEQVRPTGQADAFLDYDKAKENFIPDEPAAPTTRTAPEGEDDFRLESESTGDTTGGGVATDGLPGVSHLDRAATTDERSIRGAIQRSNQRAAAKALEAFVSSGIGQSLAGRGAGATGGNAAGRDSAGSGDAQGGETPLWKVILGHSVGAGDGALLKVARSVGEFTSKLRRDAAIDSLERFIRKDPAQYKPAEAEAAAAIFKHIPRVTESDLAKNVNWHNILDKLRQMRATDNQGQMHILMHMTALLDLPLYANEPSTMLNSVFRKVHNFAIEQDGTTGWKYMDAGAEGLIFDTGDSVIKIVPYRTFYGQKMKGGMHLKQVGNIKTSTGRDAVSLDIDYGDPLTGLDAATAAAFIPGLEATEVRGIMGTNGHVITKQRKLTPSYEGTEFSRVQDFINEHPNLIQLRSEGINKMIHPKVTRNQLLALGDDGHLYIIADFRTANTALAAEGLRIVDPLIYRVKARDLSRIPELKNKARQLFAKTHGDIGKELHRSLIEQGKRGGEQNITIPVKGPGYQAMPDGPVDSSALPDVPDKFWIDPEGKMLDIRSWTKKGEHQYAALEILRKRHDQEFSEDDSSQAVTELVKLGYRRGVYDPTLKTIFVNDHHPKIWKVTGVQFDALKPFAMKYGLDVVKEDLTTNETRKVFNFNFGGDRSWLPDTDEVSRKIPRIAEVMKKPAGVREGYTIGEHTQRVLGNLRSQSEHYDISGIGERAGIDVGKVMAYSAILHDIGKAKSGDQHKNTRAAIDEIRSELAELGLTDKEIGVISELVTHDEIGKVARTASSPSAAAKEITSRAEKAGIEASDFLSLNELLHAADAGAYPSLKEKLFKGQSKWEIEGDLMDRMRAGVRGSDRSEMPDQSELEKADDALRISTRKPWGKNVGDDVRDGGISVGIEPILQDKVFADKVATQIRSYRYLKGLVGKNSKATIENLVQHVQDNLLWLHDKFPQELRDTSSKWYDGARKITESWAKEYGYNRQSIAATLAALSPQQDWFKNVSLAKRVIEVHKNQKGAKVDAQMIERAQARAATVPELPAFLEKMKGKTFEEMTTAEKAVFVRMYDEAHNDPRYQIVSPDGTIMGDAGKQGGGLSKIGWGSFATIAKAVAALEDPDIGSISRSMGRAHKVRNFYNNIILPNSPHGDVTIDTWAVAAGLLTPFSGADREVKHNLDGPPTHGKTGSVGLYGVYAEAYRRAAAERGLLPRQMQSITWEAVRGLFESKWKKQNKPAVKQIWRDASDGKITYEQAREKIYELAGGIKPPDWAGPDARNPQGGRNTANAGELPSGGVPRGATGGAELGGGDGAARVDQARVKPEQSWLPDFMYEGTPLEGFQSKLAKVLEQKVPGKVTRSQLEATLKSQGVKPAEIEWHLGDFMRSLDPDAKITKEQLNEIMEATALRLEEVVKGVGVGSSQNIMESSRKVRDIIEITEANTGIRITRDSPYPDANIMLFRGGERIRTGDIDPGALGEIQASLAKIRDIAAQAESSVKTTPLHSSLDRTLPGGQEYRELLIKRPKIVDGDNFKEGVHWPESNVIGHVRFDERIDSKGRKIIFIQEIQSDWHQKGRKKGYAKPGDQSGLKPPDAPFKGDLWEKLLIKRMIKWAVENGAEGIAWTPGKMQGDRYSMRREGYDVIHIEHGKSWKNTNGTYDKTYTINARKKTGNKLEQVETGIEEHELAEFIGSEKAKEAIARLKSPVDLGEVEFYDQDGGLVIGGHGFLGFYDKMMPSFVKDVIKKFGGKLDETEIGDAEVEFDHTPREESARQMQRRSSAPLYKVPFFEITEAMKEVGDKIEATLSVDEALRRGKTFSSVHLEVDGPELVVQAPNVDIRLEIKNGMVNIGGMKEISPTLGKIFGPSTNPQKIKGKPQEQWLPDEPRMLSEVTPSTKFAQLDADQKAGVAKAVLPKIAKNGKLAFLEKLGVNHKIEEGIGSWEGQESPNLIITVDSDIDTARRLSAFIGDALIQDAVYTVQNKPQGSLGGVLIETTPSSEVNRKAVREALTKAGIDFTEEPQGRGWSIIDPASFEADYTDRKLARYAAKVRQAVEEFGLDPSVFRMESLAETKDTYAATIADTVKNPTPQMGASGTLDILDTAKNSLYVPAEVGYREFFQSIGQWPTKGYPATEKGYDVTESGPANPQEPNAGAVRGWTHWSNRASLSEIDPAFHGTGKVGAERARKRDYPELYIPRTYIGLEGYAPEQGLPKNEMKGQVDIRLLYDQAKDPMNLWGEALKDMKETGEYAPTDMKATTTIFERKIKEAGYAGYFFKNVAAIFYPMKPGEMMDYASYKAAHPRDARRLLRNMRK